MVSRTPYSKGTIDGEPASTSVLPAQHRWQLRRHKILPETELERPELVSDTDRLGLDHFGSVSSHAFGSSSVNGMHLTQAA